MGVGGWGVNHALWAIPTTLFPDVWFRVLYKGVYVCPYASISAEAHTHTHTYTRHADAPAVYPAGPRWLSTTG